MTAPIEPQERPPLDNPAAQETAHTKELAKGLAEAIANRGRELRNAAPQPEVHREEEIVPEEGMTEFEQSMLQAGQIPEPGQVLEQPAGEGAEEGEAPSDYEDEEVFTPEQVTALEQALTAAGVQVAVPIADIPEELRPQYVDALEQALNIVQDAQEREMAAREQSLAVEELSEKLQKSPDKVLLALAMTHPKIFEQVAQLVQEAAEDPRMRDLILRELQVEARQQDSIRRERTLQERDIAAKARVVIAATKRASQKYNVPWKTAEKVVSLAVQANGGDLDPSAVDVLVKELEVPGATRHRKVVLAETKAAQAQRAQPVVKPQTTPSTTPKQASPGLDVANQKRERGGGMFRKLVGDATRRLASSQNER